MARRSGPRGKEVVNVNTTLFVRAHSMRTWLQLIFSVSLLTCIPSGWHCPSIIRQPTKLAALVGHKEDRSVFVLRTIRFLGEEKFVLVVGDSITEKSDLPEQICGMHLPPTMPGIGGARVANFIPLAEEMFSHKTFPAATVVALGLNDANIKYWTSSKERQFVAQYLMLLDLLPAGTLLATLTAPDFSQTYARNHYSPATWSAINAAIRSVATDLKTTLIDVSPLNVDAGTTDGIHLNAASKGLWREKIVTAIQGKIGC